MLQIWFHLKEKEKKWWVKCPTRTHCGSASDTLFSNVHQNFELVGIALWKTQNKYANRPAGVPDFQHCATIQKFEVFRPSNPELSVFFSAEYVDLKAYKKSPYLPITKAIIICSQDQIKSVFQLHLAKNKLCSSIFLVNGWLKTREIF